MTDAEIDALSLDALREQVAVRVMGFNVVATDWPCGFLPDGCGREAC